MSKCFVRIPCPSAQPCNPIEFIITHIGAVQSKYENYGQLTKFSVPNPSIAATCSPCTKLLLISYFRAKIYPSCHLRPTGI